MLSVIFLFIKTLANLVSFYSHSLFFLPANFFSFSSWYFNVTLIQSYCILRQTTNKKTTYILEVFIFVNTKRYTKSPVLLQNSNPYESSNWYLELTQCLHLICPYNGDSKSFWNVWTSLPNFTVSRPKRTQSARSPQRQLQILHFKMLYLSKHRPSAPFAPFLTPRT
jgi:hypothetical protein